MRGNAKIKLAKVEKAVLRHLEKNMQGAMAFVRDEIAKEIRSGTKSGRVYKRGGRVHQTSDPGEAPANDTGRLAASLGSTVTAGRRGVTGSLFAQAKYAKALELGTARVAARPFLRPGLARNKRKILELLRRS